MPSVPIEMPSDTAMVLNSSGVPPASRMPAPHVLGQRAQVVVAGADLGPRVRDPDQRRFEGGVVEPDGLVAWRAPARGAGRR